MNRPYLNTIQFHLVTILLLLCIATTSFASTNTASPRNLAAFYTEAYGRLTPEQDKQVARAHRVFNRVLAVADRSKKYSSPVLLVVNSSGDPWAIALPDGHVILSKRALEICHRFLSLTESCLAFVLGHELAHLAHDDFLHNEVERFLATRSKSVNTKINFTPSPDLSTRELSADDAGFVYAAMAGYPVDRLLSDSSDFFKVWMQQTNTNVGELQVSPNTRMEILRKRLTQLQQKLMFFKYGVRLSHFDQCDDGVHFFHEFHKSFSGREVLNNLGFCYLQIALQHMDPQRSYFYWLPGVLDIESRADFFVRRNGITLKKLKSSLNKQSKEYLTKAKTYLKEAIDADALYIPARINLAIVYLHLGKPDHANAVLAEALEVDKANIHINMLRALALYESSTPDLDLWSHAVANLDKMSKTEHASIYLRYNLARLYSLKHKKANANQQWSKLIEQVDYLPTPIRTIVCQQTNTLTSKKCQMTIATQETPLPWIWPVKQEMKKRFQLFNIKTYLPDWNRLSFDWFQESLHGNIALDPTGSGSVLELDNMLQMQVVKKNLPSKSDLDTLCRDPMDQRTITQGVVLSCQNWAALVQNDQVTEVWWIAR